MMKFEPLIVHLLKLFTCVQELKNDGEKTKIINNEGKPNTQSKNYDEPKIL